MTRDEAIKELKAIYGLVLANFFILKEEYWDDDGYGHETKQYDDTMLALDMAIKALEQEPKTGHWIMTNDYLTTAYGSVDYVKCSCCGEDSLEEGNYCPNCGAKMIEPQESEE